MEQKQKQNMKWKELIEFLEVYEGKFVMKDDKQKLLELIGLVDYLHPKQKRIYKYKNTGEIIESITKVKRMNLEIEENNKKFKTKKQLIEYIIEYQYLQTYIDDLDVLNFYLNSLGINYKIIMIELSEYEKKIRIGNTDQYRTRIIPLHFGWKIEKINM